MNNKITTLFSFLIILVGCEKNADDRVVFTTNDATLTIKINDEIASETWFLDTSLRPDVFEAACTQEKNEVVFVDQVDSISFTIGLGDTVDFVIITAEKDSAFTRIVGVEPLFNFSEEYIERHTGKTNIEIPEVSELANILMALHKDVEKDKNMTDSDTDYYRRVKAYFQDYTDHPMIDTIQKYIGDIRFMEDGTVSMFSNESYFYYYALKMNACVYEFNDSGEIVNKGYIKEMAKGWSAFDPFKDKELMEDFAKKSNFRAFYQENKPYYDSLITTYKKLNPIADMQQWLDNKFRFSYGNYTIYFSPLVHGAHSTQGFGTGGFKQTFMFIARAEYNEAYSETINELQESRVVFTEIDHNYVNPTSDKYRNRIDSIFADREVWTKDELANMYDNPYKVFNEYMTFAVYSLYVSDTYEEKDLLAFLPQMETQMEKSRGFIKFKLFNRALLAHHQKNPNSTIEELYDFILDWSEDQL